MSIKDRATMARSFIMRVIIFTTQITASQEASSSTKEGGTRRTFGPETIIGMSGTMSPSELALSTAPLAPQSD